MRYLLVLLLLSLPMVSSADECWPGPGQPECGSTEPGGHHPHPRPYPEPHPGPYPGPHHPQPIPHTPGYPYYPTPTPGPYPYFPYPQPQPVFVCSVRGGSGYFYTGWGVRPDIAQWYANNYCFSNEPYCYFYGCILR